MYKKKTFPVLQITLILPILIDFKTTPITILNAHKTKTKNQKTKKQEPNIKQNT